jgi:tetratricopeptide (TPR) repeat protein
VRSRDTAGGAFPLLDDDLQRSQRRLQAVHRDQVLCAARQGVLALQPLDLTTGTQARERALAMAGRLGDLDREARECNSLGIARREAGDTAHALALIERSLAIARRIRNPRREAPALSNLGLIHIDLGDYAAAVGAARRAIAAEQALDDPWGS